MDELAAKFILLPGLPEASVVPAFFDAIGLDAAEELDDMRQEDIFITAGRDLDTTLSSSFLFLNSFRHHNAANQAEIVGAT